MSVLAGGYALTPAQGGLRLGIVSFSCHQVGSSNVYNPITRWWVAGPTGNVTLINQGTLFVSNV